MVNYFYAYHGPDNSKDFDYAGGYGVSQERKWSKVKVGDLVFVIQKRKQNSFFELCGVFKVESHYINRESRRSYRLELSDFTGLQSPIKLSEDELDKELPRIKGDGRWSIFKRHFCRQGVSFQSQLDNRVIEVLKSKLPAEALVSSGAANDGTNGLESGMEGEQTHSVVTRYERDPKLRKQAIEAHGDTCTACGFNFGDFYGDYAAGLIHIHHKTPISELGGSNPVNPETDLVPLCANCHSVVHRYKNRTLSIEKLRSYIEEANNKAPR